MVDLFLREVLEEKDEVDAFCSLADCGLREFFEDLDVFFARILVVLLYLFAVDVLAQGDRERDLDFDALFELVFDFEESLDLDKFLDDPVDETLLMLLLLPIELVFDLRDLVDAALRPREVLERPRALVRARPLCCCSSCCSSLHRLRRRVTVCRI